MFLGPDARPRPAGVTQGYFEKARAAQARWRMEFRPFAQVIKFPARRKKRLIFWREKFFEAPLDAKETIHSILCAKSKPLFGWYVDAPPTAAAPGLS